ncbi:MAG: TonB-dependent receptor [Pseudomonadota bacterium]
MLKIRFGRTSLLWLMGSTSLGWALPAAAQDGDPRPASPPRQEAPPSENPDEAEIVVTGQLRGAVVGDIQPEIQLTPADVRSYGVSSVGELLTALSPQTSSGRGRDGGGPVVLLNGRRISDFREIRDLPTEAIERVDILPEEVALKYGYRADQRVVNIVIRERFRSITGELQGGVPTAGGMSEQEGELGILRISRKGRININVDYERNSGLLESERDIVPTRGGLFDSAGNITALDGTSQIDSALSELAGTPVTVAGVPGSAASGAPALADFVPTANIANVGGPSAYRTLVSPTDNLKVNGVVNRTLSDKVQATFNASFEFTGRESLLGLPGTTLTLPAGNPFSPFANDVSLFRYADGQTALKRSATTQAGHLGFTLNGDGADWRWNVTGTWDRTTTHSVTDNGLSTDLMQAALDANDSTFNPFGALPASLIAYLPADIADSHSNVGALNFQTSGKLFRLPAGEVNTSIRVGGTTSDYTSDSLRAGVAQSSSISRDTASGQVNLDVPISSRRDGFLAFLGDFGVNGNVEVQRLSDFGTLVTTGYGARWAPVSALRFLVSVTDEEGAPSAGQLGDPIVSNPNVRVYDYVRGETVDVTTITGGNPDLVADSRHVTKIGMNLRPFDKTDLTFSADYVSSTTRNQSAGMPAATAEIEAAFPDRFVRDPDGRLIQIDNRPVNFARAERSQLRWGVNFSMPLGSTAEKRFQARRAERMAARERAEEAGAPPPGGPPGEGQTRPEGGQRPEGGPPNEGGRRFGGPGGGPGGPGGGPGGGRFGRLGGPNGAFAGRVQFAVYHTWHFKDEVTIRDGLPVLDLLDGSATGSSGGQPRHEVEVQAGVMKDGFGLRLSGNWQSGTRVDAGTAASPQTLYFSPKTTVNLRLFANLGQQIPLVRKHRFFLGARVSLSVDNLFDNRLHVTDQTGATPLSYQPDLLDPQGRTVKISFRKLFF